MLLRLWGSILTCKNSATWSVIELEFGVSKLLNANSSHTGLRWLPFYDSPQSSLSCPLFTVSELSSKKTVQVLSVSVFLLFNVF